jgi:hypothetical protein
MLQPLDGPAKQGKLTGVTDSTPVEVKVDASPYEERKVITLQSTKQDTNYGSFYVYFSEDGTTPSAGDVSDNGFVHPKNAIQSYEAGEQQHVWVMSVSGTIDVRVSERS